MDDFCTARGTCKLPVVTIGGYQQMSNGVNRGVTTTNLQGQVNLTSVKASHTLRGGVDIRRAWRAAEPGGNTSGSFAFNNTYTRAADTTTDFPAANLGLSLAAFMLGIPSTASITQQSPARLKNDYYSWFAQDSWRVTPNLTINLGLRFEYEIGIAEAEDRMLVGFDPNAELAITQLAQAAYAANPIPEVPASQFRVVGGPIFASDAGQDGQSWNGQAMWMPRLSATYKLGDRTVLKGGWGLFYDTLNAADFNPNQTGYDVTTTSTVSTDFGQTWLFGDPKNGISPLTNPFPVRSDGSRFDTPIGSSLGVDTLLGQNYTANNLNREHGRVQRWRVSLQRELTRNMAVEVGLQRLVRRPSFDRHRPELRAGDLLQQQQRPRQRTAGLPADQCDEPVPHHQLRVVAGHGPRPVSTHGGQCVLHGRDRPAAGPAPRLSADVGADLCRSAARKDQDPPARNHAQPAVLAGPQRQCGVLSHPGHAEPDR